MSLTAVGLNHTTAPVELREQLAVPREELETHLDGLIRSARLEEVMLLSTCNRVEVYAVHGEQRSHDYVVDALAELRGVRSRDMRSHAFARGNDDAARHIFRVTASLESMVLGEPQILGQVKDAYRAARDAGTVGSVLDRCLTMAFRGAKRVRNETLVSTGAASVASVSVDLAVSIFGDLVGQRVLVVGAGLMAQQAAMHLRGAGAGSMVVVNRSEARGRTLAEAVGGRYVEWSRLEAELAETDIVVTSTGAKTPVIDRGMVRRAIRARRGKPLFLVDIAVPRDVDPRVGRLSQVYLYNVDDLQAIVQENLQSRAAHAEQASVLVDQEVDAFLRWTRSRAVAPVLKKLEDHAVDIRDREVGRALARLGELSPEQRKVIESLGHAIVRKMLHHPLSAVREAGEEGSSELAGAVARLFPLEGADDDTPPPEEDDQ